MFTDVPAASTAPADLADGDVLVEARGLTKHYGPIKAVDGIDLTVRRGEILGFLGPNGAGKTTAMRMLTGFLRPDAGSVRIAGHDLTARPLAARRAVGYLPENAPAYGEMTVHGFLRFVADARGLDDVDRAIAASVARAGLDEVLQQPIETLSKGFKRRVGLAQALIHDPAVLVLDEPTDGLDPNQKVLVHQLIVELARESAVILSTHILDEVERICTRAMIIDRGRIEVDATPAALVARAPRHNELRVELAEPRPTLAARLRTFDWCAAVESADGGRRLTLAPADGANHLAALLAALDGEPVVDVRVHEGRLDDLFRQLTGGHAS
ncbi:MAG: ABC transporter ATP-binding protein [Acidobacteriota bacterium]